MRGGNGEREREKKKKTKTIGMLARSFFLEVGPEPDPEPDPEPGPDQTGPDQNPCTQHKHKMIIDREIERDKPVEAHLSECDGEKNRKTKNKARGRKRPQHQHRQTPDWIGKEKDSDSWLGFSLLLTLAFCPLPLRMKTPAGRPSQSLLRNPEAQQRPQKKEKKKTMMPSSACTMHCGDDISSPLFIYFFPFLTPVLKYLPPLPSTSCVIMITIVL